MATRAFAELPERYSNQQVIARFCQGLQDSMAGHHVCMQKPNSIEKAMNEVHLYQHTRKATFGNAYVESQTTAASYYEPSNVYAVQYSKQHKSQASKNEDACEMQDTIKKIQKYINSLVAKLGQLDSSSKTRYDGTKRRRCFGCGKIRSFSVRLSEKSEI